METKLNQWRGALHGNKAADAANRIVSRAVSMAANARYWKRSRFNDGKSIGSEAVSKTANGIRSANGIGSDTASLVHMATEQVAVSLETDTSVGVVSTRDISESTTAMATMMAMSQGGALFWSQQL